MAGRRHPSDSVGGVEGHADGAGLAAAIDAEEPICRLVLPPCIEDH